MGTLKRQIVTRSIPANATFYTVAQWKSNGKARTAKYYDHEKPSIPLGARLTRFVEWVVVSSKTKSAQLNKAGTRLRCQTGTWIACYTDADGVKRQVPTGCRDRQAAMAVLAAHEQQKELIKANVITSDQAKIAQFADTLLTEHISEFLAYQREKRTSPVRIKAYETRLSEVAASCDWRYLRDLSSDKLSGWLAAQVDGKRKMGASVYNGFVEVWVAFGNWCLGKRTKGKYEHHNGQKRLLVNPF